MARLLYYGNRISPNMTRTPEGYLICHNVPIARTGEQQYLAGELGVTDCDPREMIPLTRLPEDVFSPASLASYEGKPVVFLHPEEDVDPSNIAMYQKGHVQNVRQGTGEDEGLVLADLFITDPTLINEIESGTRQVSCGYHHDTDTLPDGSLVQRNIRGNHVAVVPEGRAGARVAIQDSKPVVHEPTSHKRRSPRMKTKDTQKKSDPLRIRALLSYFQRARDAQPEDLEDIAADAVDCLGATGDTGDAVDTTPATPAGDLNADANAALLAKALEPVLAAIKEVSDRVAALESAKVKDGEPDEVEQLIAELESANAEEEAGENEDTAEGEESVTVPAEEMNGEDCSVDAGDAKAAKDNNVALLKSLRPVIASIQNPEEKKKALDALRTAMLPAKKTDDTMKKILDATNNRPNQRSKDGQPGEVDYAAQQAAFDAANPHKKKEAK